MYTYEQKVEFEHISRQLIAWLNDNGNPHMTIIVDTTHAELLSGEVAFQTLDYVRD